MCQGRAYSPPRATCDQPNRLNLECDPGSRFQVLTPGPDAYVVAHCRKKTNDPDNHKYGDIAVIQYNRKNGATCFYQSMLTTELPEDVKAPSKGQAAWGWWLTPSGTAGGRCGGCHDNGPFIRSPYLNQVKGPNMLPGSDPSVVSPDGRFFNLDQPYAFVGEDFKEWKAFKVEITDNECNNCHRLGVNNVTPGNGTALKFAIRATAESELAKNPPTKDFPVWMPPHPPFPDQVPPLDPVHAKAAKDINDCAMRWQEKNPLPDKCSITLFAEAYKPPFILLPILPPISMMPIYYYLLND